MRQSIAPAQQLQLLATPQRKPHRRKAPRPTEPDYEFIAFLRQAADEMERNELALVEMQRQELAIAYEALQRI